MHISVKEYETYVQKRIKKAEAKLKSVHDSVKKQLQTEIEELERQLRDPENALIEARERIKSLEIASIARVTHSIQIAPPPLAKH
jgi:predicted  nucleic acid-binding Zn-ribbon protein